MVITDSLNKQLFFKAGVFAALVLMLMVSCKSSNETGNSPRERLSLDKGWRFMKYDSEAAADSLIYDVRPSLTDYNDSKDADSKPTESLETEAKQMVLKPWILPSGNAFIKDPANRHIRPEGNPGSDFAFVQYNFNDSAWQEVNLPHDWAIKGPFLQGWNAETGGGMGRLESNGVAWYRRKLDISEADTSKSVFLEVDGAMSYAMVWLNGNLVGGWPYGYNSWQLDLTPYLNVGGENQLAIRIDNPPASSRWYPGGGIYRNVWLIKTNKVHVGQWGTYITTRNVSEKNATIDLK
ncbi:MAG TPA: beta galactosidase jelly roll domain-containing protein, partial [Bacteroidales bacterium]|nr:beta galactosidase jelly roll domain-containing protein [Bacteroidales bacterium]